MNGTVDWEGNKSVNVYSIEFPFWVIPPQPRQNQTQDENPAPQSQAKEGLARLMEFDAYNTMLRRLIFTAKPLAPCAVQLATMLNCWASAGDIHSTQACAEAAKDLQRCMAGAVSFLILFRW